jgi:hypothetical protein
VLLVKDNAGNTATCTSKVHVNCFKPTCLITPDATPFGTYPGLTGNGTPGNPYLLYLGYGPASVTLAGPASSGAATISNYTWSYSSSTAGAAASVIPCTPSGSAACNTAIFTPTAEGIYTIQLSITSQDPEGKETCSSTCSITICVRDIRYEDDDDLDEPGDEPADDDPMSVPANAAPNAKKKIVMCHWDASKSKFKTMKVASINVSTHLSHGDYLGKCKKKCGDLKKKKKPANTSRMAGSQVITDGNLKMVPFPNPTSKDFHITLQGNDATSADIFVYDLTGRIIEQYLAQSVNTEISVGIDLTPGIYMIGVRHDGQLRMAKVVKQ